MSAGRLPCTRNGRPSCARGRREILLAGEAVRSLAAACSFRRKRRRGSFSAAARVSEEGTAFPNDVSFLPRAGKGRFFASGRIFSPCTGLWKVRAVQFVFTGLRTGLRVFTKRENLSTRRFLPCSAMSGAGFFRFFPAPAGKDFRMPASRISGMIFRSGGLTVKHGRERP